MSAKKIDLEELFSALSHGLGAFLSILGFSWLLFQSFLHRDTAHIAAVSIYGVSLVVLYTFSTLYHSFQAPQLKRIFRILDHCAIYLLIAGSYTPFALLIIKGTFGNALLISVWSLTLFGIIFKVFFTGRYELFSNLLYLFMGWLSLLAIKPMMENLDVLSLSLLFIGGASYSLGIIFYLWERLPFNHSIWHLFVMGGSACHFFSISNALF